MDTSVLAESIKARINEIPNIADKSDLTLTDIRGDKVKVVVYANPQMTIKATEYHGKIVNGVVEKLVKIF